MDKKFVHLNIHSEYSLVNSTIRCKDLARRCQEYGMPAVAVTDVTNTYGAVKHYRACIQHGLKPVIGAHLWISENADYQHAHQLSVLTMNRNGFQSLCHLLTQSYLHNQHQGKGYVDAAQLLEFGKDLIVLSGATAGQVGQAAVAGDMALAEKICRDYKARFPDRFYLELQRIGAPDEEAHVTAAVELATLVDVPVVATNAVHFIDEADFNAHEIRVCIQEGRLIEDKRRKRRFTREQFLKNAIQMHTLFADIPEALDNTLEIAKRCNYRFAMGENFLPNYQSKSRASPDKVLVKQSRQGLVAQLKKSSYAHIEKHYRQRLESELEIINQMGFSSYFLIVADFIGWAKQHKIPVGPGRGSGAGSLVAYALDITELDPIEHDLLFERFLNPERVSMPDFDIDFCMQGRDRVIEYVTDKYGADKVAQIITYNSMTARSVVRDVGRVLGMNYGHVDKIAKLIPFEVGITLDMAMKQEPELRSLYKNDQVVTELIDNARALEGLARNVGKHAGGVVIAPTRLTDFSPLYTEQGSTQSVTQFDKDDLEAIGLVKFDFLGLKTLTVIDWALASINAARASGGEAPIKLEGFDLMDSKTYDLLKAARTTAVFQLESRGMKDLIKRLKPDVFDDLVALVALYRPGPLESGMVDDYVNRKHGETRVSYLNPVLEPVLKPTYGVILYQEQVMQIAQIMGGYSLGSADLLRRAMGKKKPEEMAKHREIFVSGSEANGIKAKTSEKIFDLMEKFAGYGFNKSHSAAYALISFQTAWLKANHPAHFLAASLSVDMDATDKVVMLIAEAREMGITVLQPDINQCGYKFVARDESTILYGLGAIKGLGKPVIDALIEEREANGAYSDLFDLCRRSNTQKFNRRALEALVCAGAMDCFKVGRASLKASIGNAVDAASQHHSDVAAGQSDLFGISAKNEKTAFYASVPEWRDEERLKQEKATLGLYLSGHPVDQHRQELDIIVRSRLVDLRPSESTQIVAGLIVGIRTLFNRRNEKYAFVTIDDNTARTEVSVFAELYEGHGDMLRHDRIIVFAGQVGIDDRNQRVQVRAESLYTLADYRVQRAKALVVSVSEEQIARNAGKFRHLIQHAGKSGLPVILNYRKQGCMVQIKLGDEYCVYPDNQLLYALQELFGENAISINYLSRGANSGKIAT